MGFTEVVRIFIEVLGYMALVFLWAGGLAANRRAGYQAIQIRHQRLMIEALLRAKGPGDREEYAKCVLQMESALQAEEDRLNG